MKYLARLISEKRTPDELPKLPKLETQAPVILPKPPKHPFDSFDSTEGMHFSENEPVRHLAGSTDSAPVLPVWCRPDCERLEIIEGVGIGCVRPLTDGCWHWRLLDKMPTCPTKIQ